MPSSGNICPAFSIISSSFNVCQFLYPEPLPPLRLAALLPAIRLCSTLIQGREGAAPLRRMSTIKSALHQIYAPHIPMPGYPPDRFNASAGFLTFLEEIMSLTAKGEAERMWGEFPALRVILETKNVPYHYYGPSTASDNMFDSLRRIAEMSILIKENKTSIIESLKCGDESYQRQLINDLSHVRNNYRAAESSFEDAIKDIDEIDNRIKSKHEKSPAEELALRIKGLALRLAWYIDKYGDVPKEEILSLFFILNGIDHSEKAKALHRLAAELEKEA